MSDETADEPTAGPGTPDRAADDAFDDDGAFADWDGLDDAGDGAGEGDATSVVLVERNHDQVRRARQRYGIAGAALAGAMIGLREVLEKPKEEVAVVSEAPSEPVDLDGHGITVTIDGRASAAVAPQPRPVGDPDAAKEWTRNKLRRNRRRG